MRKIWMLLVVLAAALTLGGCGSDDSDDGNSLSDAYGGGSRDEGSGGDPPREGEEPVDPGPGPEGETPGGPSRAPFIYLKVPHQRVMHTDAVRLYARCSARCKVRFSGRAQTAPRAKRAKRIRTSPLDDVSGLGETRKQALIKHFGSVKKLRQATIDEICEVPGIGRRTAESVAAALASTAPAAPAVNTATGEIIEEDDGGSS